MTTNGRHADAYLDILLAPLMAVAEWLLCHRREGKEQAMCHSGGEAGAGTRCLGGGCLPISAVTLPIPALAAGPGASGQGFRLVRDLL